MGTDEYNRKAYDQVLIRFPAGTKRKFRELSHNDYSFNAWVVNLVTAALENYELQLSEKN